MALNFEILTLKFNVRAEHAIERCKQYIPSVANKHATTTLLSEHCRDYPPSRPRTQLRQSSFLSYQEVQHNKIYIYRSPSARQWFSTKTPLQQQSSRSPCDVKIKWAPIAPLPTKLSQEQYRCTATQLYRKH